MQERLGLELGVLAEDPGGATAAAIAREAHTRLAAQPARAPAAAAGAQPALAARGTTWIAPAPASVKLRLFCLPYAGGVSENVYARRAPAPGLHARMCEWGMEAAPAAAPSSATLQKSWMRALCSPDAA